MHPACCEKRGGQLLEKLQQLRPGNRTIRIFRIVRSNTQDGILSIHERVSSPIPEVELFEFFE